VPTKANLPVQNPRYASLSRTIDANQLSALRQSAVQSKDHLVARRIRSIARKNPFALGSFGRECEQMEDQPKKQNFKKLIQIVNYAQNTNLSKIDASLPNFATGGWGCGIGACGICIGGGAIWTVGIPWIIPGVPGCWWEEMGVLCKNYENTIAKGISQTVGRYFGPFPMGSNGMGGLVTSFSKTQWAGH
jgi:hypothetical protein